MDVLTVDGKKYIKASSIATSLGYTADYVGQLCRTKKVDAQLVGRTWYVYENSIKNHKGSRYRSTQAKTVKSIREALDDTQISKKVKVETPHSSHFYSHKIALPRQSTQYEPDSTDLIPKVQKTVKLGVDLADAQKIKIDFEKEAFLFDTPKSKPITFKGTLVVSEYDDSQRYAPEGGSLIHPREVSTLKSQNIPKNKVITAKQVIQKVSRNTVHLTPKDSQAGKETVVEFVHNFNETGTTTKTLMTRIASATLILCSCLIFILLIGTKQQIFITSESTHYNFVFNFESCIDAVLQLVEALF